MTVNIASQTRGLHGWLLLTLITSVCSSGFLLFGYDQGVMSGVNISSYYLDTVGHPSALMLGTITALYDVGAVAGAIAAAFAAEPLGRKRTLILGASVLIVGSIIMAASYGRVQFMVGRIFTGIGIGFITSCTPVYQSEIARAGSRGWMVCCQLSTMLFGLMLAYWINYGFYYVSNSAQWRFPLAFQSLFAVYIVVVTSFLPDTPRWLIRHDGIDSPSRGLEVLARLRNKPITDPAVVAEKNAIVQAISIEAAEEGTWGDLFRGNGIAAHKRFYLALGIQFMQQMTGINIVTYYAPTLYQDSLGMSQEMALFLGCWTQVWYLLASFLTWYTIDRVGRRMLFITMAIGMCGVLVAEAICVAVGNTGASIGAVAMVFLFEACFTWGWMATVWIYPAEILPLKTRAKGASLAAAADFLGNFLVVEVTPVGLDNLGWRFYIVWAVLNLASAGIVWSLYPETGGLPLEAIDGLFVDKDDSDSFERNALQRALQWKQVAKNARAVKEFRRRGKNVLGVESGSVEEDSLVSGSGSGSGSGGGAAKTDGAVQHVEHARAQ